MVKVMFKIYGTIGKVLTRGAHLSNMNAQSLTVRKLWPMYKSRSKVRVNATRLKFMVPLEKPCHKERIGQI